MSDIKQLQSFINWRDGKYEKYHFDITVTENELGANWKETFFLKLTPGCCLMWHYDSFSAFVKFQNIDMADYGKVKRAAIMINDWNFGQTIQLGDHVFGHWKKGDVYTWQGDMWHGAGNFGLSNLVCFQVTYLDV